MRSPGVVGRIIESEESDRDTPGRPQPGAPNDRSLNTTKGSLMSPRAWQGLGIEVDLEVLSAGGRSHNRNLARNPPAGSLVPVRPIGESPVNRSPWSSDF